MKPLVYTAALEEGMTAKTKLQDEPLKYYKVKNYDGTYQGTVSLYQAMIQSLNPPAVEVLKKVGIERAVKEIEKFGIPLTKDDEYYGLVLGGLSKGATPLQMADAYTVFANGGKRYPAHFIKKIVNAEGEVVVDNTDTRPVRVTSKRVADEMTSILEGVYNEGTGAGAKPAGYSIAGKTGTTETVVSGSGKSESKDQWMIGYTPDIVIATWMGYDKTSDTNYLAGSSGTTLSSIFKAESEAILPYTQKTPFDADEVTESSLKQSVWSTMWDKTKEKAKNLKDKVSQDLPALKQKAQEILGQLGQ